MDLDEPKSGVPQLFFLNLKTLNLPDNTIFNFNEFAFFFTQNSPVFLSNKFMQIYWLNTTALAAVNTSQTKDTGFASISRFCSTDLS